MSRILTATMVLGLAGCATAVQVPKTVEVPVDNSPVTVMPVCIPFPAPASSAPADMNRAAKARDIAMRECISALQSALAPYTKQ